MSGPEEPGFLTGLKRPAPVDTSPSAMKVQMGVHAALGGLGRMKAVSEMFDAWRAMLAMKYGSPLHILRHMHGDGIAPADYSEIARIFEIHAE